MSANNNKKQIRHLPYLYVQVSDNHERKSRFEEAVKEEFLIERLVSIEQKTKYSYKKIRIYRGF